MPGMRLDTRDLALGLLMNRGRSRLLRLGGSFGYLAVLMYQDKKVVVVMPAYNAARTLRQTYSEVREQQIVDTIILVDDRSRDETVAVARALEGVQVHVHQVNKGYGANQKTCYRLALEAGADIVIMIHPDYQVPRPG